MRSIHPLEGSVNEQDSRRCNSFRMEAITCEFGSYVTLIFQYYSYTRDYIYARIRAYRYRYIFSGRVIEYRSSRVQCRTYIVDIGIPYPSVSILGHDEKADGAHISANDQTDDLTNFSYSRVLLLFFKVMTLRSCVFPGYATSGA